MPFIQAKPFLFKLRHFYFQQSLAVLVDGSRYFWNHDINGVSMVAITVCTCQYYDLHFAEEIHESFLAKRKIRQKLSHTYPIS